MIEAPERPKTQTGGSKPPSPPKRPPTTGLLEPIFNPPPPPERRPSRYHGRMAHKVIATIVILVVAAFLAGTVHPFLGLVALLALLLWL